MFEHLRRLRLDPQSVTRYTHLDDLWTFNVYIDPHLEHALPLCPIIPTKIDEKQPHYFRGSMQVEFKPEITEHIGFFSPFSDDKSSIFALRKIKLIGPLKFAYSSLNSIEWREIEIYASAVGIKTKAPLSEVNPKRFEDLEKLILRLQKEKNRERPGPDFKEIYQG